MPKRKINSRALRQFAEHILSDLAEGEILPTDRDDLATSVVRQWITYDGHATLIVGRQHYYLELDKAALGNCRVTLDRGLPAWQNRLEQDWKIDPEEFPEIFGQLNRGQSVEVVNREGAALRLWMNPKEHSMGVEPQVKKPVPPGLKRDNHKIAVDLLEGLFGTDFDPDVKDELACSVALQWQRYAGHASLFGDRHRQWLFTLTEQADGGCSVTRGAMGVDLEPLLTSLGFTEEMIPDVVHRINLGQEVMFQDRQGIPSVLWHDPQTRRISVRVMRPAPPMATSEGPAIFCPQCSAVLTPWTADVNEQTCPICGHVVSR